jgi:hypothetical protein
MPRKPKKYLKSPFFVVLELGIVKALVVLVL